MKLVLPLAFLCTLYPPKSQQFTTQQELTTTSFDYDLTELTSSNKNQNATFTPELLKSKESEDIVVFDHNAQFLKTYSRKVNASTIYMFKYHYHDSKLRNKALRLHVESLSSTASEPVIVVVRHEKGVLSWQLPLIVQLSGGDRISEYRSVNRTLCPIDDYDLTPAETKKSQDREFLTISVSTAYLTDTLFSLLVYYQEDYIVGMNETRTFDVTPAAPQYFEFHFPDDLDIVLLSVNSPDKLCMTVSVQNITCPISDLDSNVEFEGIWQTADQKAGMTIRRDMFPSGLHIVFVVKPDDADCSNASPLNVNDCAHGQQCRKKRVTFELTKKISKDEYLVATFGAFFMFCGSYLIVIIVSCVICVRKRRDPVERSLLDTSSMSNPGNLIRPYNPRPMHDSRLRNRYDSMSSTSTLSSTTGDRRGGGRGNESSQQTPPDEGANANRILVIVESNQVDGNDDRRLVPASTSVVPASTSVVPVSNNMEGDLDTTQDNQNTIDYEERLALRYSDENPTDQQLNNDQHLSDNQNSSSDPSSHTKEFKGVYNNFGFTIDKIIVEGHLGYEGVPTTSTNVTDDNDIAQDNNGEERDVDDNLTSALEYQQTNENLTNILNADGNSLEHQEQAQQEEDDYIRADNIEVDGIGEMSNVDMTDYDLLEDADLDKDVFRTKTFLYVSDLARKHPTVLHRRSMMYHWNLLTISIFYGLPVVQLVVTYQTVLHQTGNEDLCYYNFLCAHPLGLLSDFNHVYSNLGYVMLGGLFMVFVWRREYMYNQQVEENPAIRMYGIPQHSGIFYAMALALIMEGLMSGCYHICPNHSNFQFDTAFMYTIAILCMLKIYQFRHPDINANAYTAFGVLAFVIFIGVLGVTNSTIPFWIFFTGCHVITCMIVSIQIYYMGRWKVNAGLFKRVWLMLYNDILSMGMGHWRALKPTYPGRLFLMLVFNVINWAMATYGVVVIAQQEGDFASFLLGVFISNLLLYTSFYIIMKLRHGERICRQAMTYILLSWLCWAPAMYFFLNKSTTWQLLPAESRRYNQSCRLFHFYDNHDIWHFLSALALFFSFMILLTIDDDLAEKPRDKIPVF